MAQNFLQKAVDMVKIATDLDSEHKYSDALKEYQNAIEYFLLALRYEKNKKLQDTIRGKIQEYLIRAEKLKALTSANTQGKLLAHGPGPDDINAGDDADKKALRQALMGTIIIDKPNVKWAEVAGLDEAKSTLQEAVILPLRFPQLFTGNRKPWRGILLFGPPGTGKSYLAKAVATEANNSTFISVSSSDLVSKWQGQSERLIKTLFEIAREKKPCIIFIDEIDSMCSTRSDSESESSRRIKTEFFVQMQGVGTDNEGILVLGATNIPWALDPAMRRRFEKRIYIPLPEFQSRIVMFKHNIGETPHSLTDENFKELALSTENYSGADIGILVRDAIMEPIRKIQNSTHFKKIKDSKTNKIMWTGCSPGDIGAIEKNWMDIESSQIKEAIVDMYDMLRAVKRTKPSVNHADLKQFDDWASDFGQDG
jgi:vacuolar protein-sorting-associated protein 4